MSYIKTTSGENTITFDAFYQYIWARNYGDTDVYISNHNNIVAGDDDVALLPAGEAVRLTVNGKTLYVLGSTTLEVHAQNFSDTPFAWNEAGESGGSDISVVSLSVYDNGTYTAPSGKAYSPITVAVSPNVGTKTITHDGTYNASSDNLDGYSSVVVDTAPHLPSGYTAISYVECPSTGQAGFAISNYNMPKYDIVESLTMPYAVSDEAAFAGVDDNFELYYYNNKAMVWGSNGKKEDYLGDRSVSANEQCYHRAANMADRLSDFTIGYYKPESYLFNGRIYYLRIYSPTNLSEGISVIHDFVPCIQDSTSKVGMYDMIGNDFYSSTTGTEFVAPASV